MQYNTQREQLVMPEYGRGVQMMVDMAVMMESREERQRCANAIVKVMASLQPQTTNKEDGEHRLWNHLARIAHYELDIDYPVNIVPEAEVMAHPAPLHYPMKRIRHKHYGHLIEQALEYTRGIENPDERRALTESIANQMKQDLFMWNRDAMDDALVAQDIRRYTDDDLDLDLDSFRFDKVGESPLQLSDGGKKRKRRK